jgi:murein DD-endopeptidase MepM/ murein hydrolase activator NlpD
VKNKKRLVSVLAFLATGRASILFITGCLFFSIATPNRVIAADEISRTATKNLAISADKVTKSVIDYGSAQESTTSIMQNIQLPQEKFDPNYYVHPLLDKGCEGYTITRGWTSGHTGVDLQKKGGCWINSVASGVVERADQCDGGLGYCVEILQDNGYRSLYAHGNGKFAVEKGFRVNPGDKIMFMGCTGKCTGTHLHFSMSRPGFSLAYTNRINPVGILEL